MHLRSGKVTMATAAPVNQPLKKDAPLRARVDAICQHWHTKNFQILEETTTSSVETRSLNFIMVCSHCNWSLLSSEPSKTIQLFNYNATSHKNNRNLKLRSIFSNLSHEQWICSHFNRHSICERSSTVVVNSDEHSGQWWIFFYRMADIVSVYKRRQHQNERKELWTFHNISYVRVRSPSGRAFCYLGHQKVFFMFT